MTKSFHLMRTRTRSLNEQNNYVCFRTLLYWDKPWYLELYAEDAYECFCNEKILGYGPGKSGEPLCYFDRYEMAAGTVFLAVKCYGRNGSAQWFARAYDAQSGEEIPMEWHCFPLNSYSAKAPRTIGDTGFSEYYDLASMERDWFRATYHPAQREELPIPARSIAASSLLASPIPRLHLVRHEPRSLKHEKETWVADFGEMVYGRVFLKGERWGDGSTFLNYIEDPERGWASSDGLDAMYSDKLFGMCDHFSWHSFAKRGFRWLRISGNIATVNELFVESAGYVDPTAPKGSFICSEERLNRIEDLAERTLAVCMDSIYNDCPHRDQAQWMDAFVSSRTANTLYGALALTRKSILQHAKCSFLDGKLLSPSICGWSFMPDYALVQFLYLRDYYRWSGDLALVREVLENCREGLRYFERFENPDDGLLENLAGAYCDNTFELCKLGKSAILNALYYGALQAFAELLSALGAASDNAYAAEIARLQRKAEALRHAFGICFRHPHYEGLLIDSDQHSFETFQQLNFSCEMNDRWRSESALATFSFEVAEDCDLQLSSCAFDRYRLSCDGVLVAESRRAADWGRCHPALEPERTTLNLKAGRHEMSWRVTYNALNFEGFCSLRRVASGEEIAFSPVQISEIDDESGRVVRVWEGERNFRHFEFPTLAQSVHAYAAYTGVWHPEERQLWKTLLPETYFRNYISVRVPEFCRATEEVKKLTNWVLPVNTPWTAYYFLSALFDDGMGAEAMQFLRMAWGVMLDKNAVNCFEEFDDNASLCHAWGAVPAYFFHREILGFHLEEVVPNEEGVWQICLHPALYDLEHASGKIRVSKPGDDNAFFLYVTLERMPQGTIRIHCEAPDGCCVKIDDRRCEGAEFV